MSKTTTPADLLTLAQTLHVVTSLIPTVNTLKLDVPVTREPGTPSTPTSTKEVLKSQAELHEAINLASNKPKLPKRKDTISVTVTTNKTEDGKTVSTTNEVKGTIEDHFKGDALTKNDREILTLINSRLERGRVTENLLLSTVAKAAGFSTTKVTSVIRKYLADKVELVFGARLTPGMMYEGYTPASTKAYYIVPKNLIKKDT